MPKVGERQHLTTVAGLDGFWAVQTGGDSDREVTKVFDGGSKKADLIIGDTETDNLVVGRPWDTVRDAPIYNRLRALLDAGGSFLTTIATVDTDADFARAGDPRSWEGELKTLRAPEGNRQSSNPKRIELVFVCR